MDTTKLEAVTQEIIGLEELKKYLSENKHLQHYIGFEISGLVHLGTGLTTGIVIRELQKLGVNVSFYLADWHTWINNKLGGDMIFIDKVSREYFEPALKISARIAGADDTKIKVIRGSELYHNNDDYWKSVIDISKSLTLSRVTKSTTILGREDSASMPFAFLMYPPMQVADIYEMKCDICHAGTDQRKVHVIAREVAEKLKISPLKDDDGKNKKPIAIHQPLLLGLQKPKTWPIPNDIEKDVIRTEMKMSKSIPGSSIFVHDSEADIKEKINKAFCPEGEVEINPILDWAKHIIFPIVSHIVIKRDGKYGGDIELHSYEELEEIYKSGGLFSLDLKNAIADILIDILTPAREAFSSKEKQSLIESIKNNQTR